MGIDKKVMNFDTTTLKMYGEYPGISEEAIFKPAYGHSKERRNDLKQATLLLGVIGAEGLPVLIQSLDGNASDKKTIAEAWFQIWIANFMKGF